MTEANIAFVASLLADPSRAATCLALAGGEARPAGELAVRAGVSAQTASNHLAKLIAGRILRVEQQGRWRYYRLAGADVGHAVARRCLDWTERRPHVAGPVGTALASLALDRGWVRRVRGTRAVVVTPAGRTQLKKIFNVRWEERTP